ncbi:MAG: FAD-binding protein [Lachnospiraceae bacterium]|nr:FAD-binding protein [Lachnospiraceae bacterium]
MKKNYDVIIVGNGVAGLFAALHLPKDKEIAIITKGDMEECDSYLAQGGICVLKNEDDYAAFFEDTMRAGHYKNDRAAVELMIRSSQDIIRELVDFGVEFERKQGEFTYTKEGAHTASRILHHEDLTGKEITSKLLSRVKERDNISIFEHTTMVDILEKDNVCYGVMVSCNDNVHGACGSLAIDGSVEIVNETSNDSGVGDIKVMKIYSDYVIWACGGVGGLYKHSTNFRHLTGDTVAISTKHNIELKDISYVQLHPTTLFAKITGRRFLISESVRGEGAILLDKDGNRFVDELLPRDRLTEKIKEQMAKEGTDHVRLSVTHLDAEEVKHRFPNIYKTCIEQGYDITKEPIPVVPAQHYFMGGVKVDLDGHTSMGRLYAAGETACNGVHGANRLASNSLLESLVWAKRGAEDIAANYRNADHSWCEEYFENENSEGYIPDKTYVEVSEEYFYSAREQVRPGFNG